MFLTNPERFKWPRPGGHVGWHKQRHVTDTWKLRIPSASRPQQLNNLAGELCILYCFLNPSLEHQYISVHSISPDWSTLSTPADHAHQIPLSISVTDQRSSAITSAGVNTTSRVTCTAHAFCYAIAIRLEVPVASLARVTWDEGKSGLF